MYSIDIVIDTEHLKSNESSIPKALLKTVMDKKDIRVRFPSEEEKESYIKGEYIFTGKQLKEHAASWSGEDRSKAKVRLYLARRAYYNQYFSKDV